MKIKDNYQLNNLDFVIKLLEEIAQENEISWNDSFFRWELKDFGYDFSTTLPMAILFKKKKSKEVVFFEIEKKFRNFSDQLEISFTNNGYLNFTFKNCFYKSFLNSFVKDPFWFCYERNESINVEFVSVNPTGYLHLGHLRNAVIGDAIANLYKFIGFKVTKEYYLNDRGKQIEDLVKSVIFCVKKNLEINPQSFNENSFSETTYSGKSIEDVSLYLIEKGWFRENQIIEENSGLRNVIVDFFISRIRKDLESFDIFFDEWFSEKSMYSNENDFEVIFKLITSSPFCYEEDGAFFFKTSLFGDEKDRALIKKNGDYTYFFSDIIYHINKLKRSDFIVDVWGSDHHGYVQRVKSSLEMLGFKQVKEKVQIVLIQMVSLMTSEGLKKFSKRLGTSVSVEEARNLIKKDQLRFSLLETDCNNHFLINTETLNKENENSKLYYIQYAHARCSQILDNWNYSISKEISNEFYLEEEKEKKLLKSIMKFKETILRSADQKSPHTILKYLYSLSSDFHSYYQSITILKEDQLEISKQRVLLVWSVKKIIKSSLEIFSIKSVDFMNQYF